MKVPSVPCSLAALKGSRFSICNHPSRSASISFATTTCWKVWRNPNYSLLTSVACSPEWCTFASLRESSICFSKRVQLCPIHLRALHSFEVCFPLSKSSEYVLKESRIKRFMILLYSGCEFLKFKQSSFLLPLQVWFSVVNFVSFCSFCFHHVLFRVLNWSCIAKAVLSRRSSMNFI